MGWIVETSSCIEDGACRARWISRGKFALSHTIANDVSKHLYEMIYMPLANLSGLFRNLHIGSKQLWISDSSRTFRCEQEIQAAFQTISGGTLFVRQGYKRLLSASQPAFDDGIAQSDFAGKMAIDATVTEAESTR